MKIYPVIRVRNFIVILCLLSFFASSEIYAQKKKPAVKTKQTSVKDAKNNKTAAVKKTASTRSISTKAKESRKETAKRKAEESARLAERRRAEEIRRQAQLAEQRRRAAAAREAAARKAAFERGLRTETVENVIADKTDGEDLQIRRAAVDALGSRAGTVVVMEAQTGKILTIVNQDWAIRRSFKPCSTIKLVTGVAGKNENLINNDGNLNRQSSRMNLDDALAFSDNTYFQKVGANLGSERMISYARALGLGEKTGINDENESVGKLPYGNNNARIYSHGDDFEVTPLQLAVMVTAVANGGKLVVPQIPRTRAEKAGFRGYFRREVNLPKDTIQRVIAGMMGATEYGTARRAAISDLNAAGKTGSCISGGSWVGLFASIAPVENPQFVVIVITRGQTERGKYAALVAGKIYQALRPRFTDRRNKVLLAELPPQFKPKNNINLKASELLDEDDEDDPADESSIAETRNPSSKKGVPRETARTDEEIIVAPKITKNNNEQVKNTAPLFSPVVIEYKKDAEIPESASPTQITRPRVVGVNP